MEVDYAEGSFRIGEDNILDLAQAVREYSMLSTPIGPRCKEECKGICPQCGRNLNAATCNCNFNEKS